MKTYCKSFAAASAVGVLLAACGGGSGSPSTDQSGPVTPPPNSTCSFCAADTVAGVAAGGDALAQGSVILHDATGAERRAAVAADGRFTINVTGLTAPFMLQATGLLGGVPVQLHGLALAEDVGKNTVNLTPLTEVLSANVLCADPAAAFGDFVSHAGSVTRSALQSADDALRGSLAQVAAAFGVGAKSLRADEFAVGDKGLDAMLDALRVSMELSDAGTPLHVVTALGTGNAITVERCGAAPGPLAYDAKAAQDLATSRAALAEIDGALQQFAAAFATALPTAETLGPMFLATDFRHNGQTLDEWFNRVLLDPADPDPDTPNRVGMTIGAARIVDVLGPDDLVVTAEMRFTSPHPQTTFRQRLRKVDGHWLMMGNRRFAQSSVTLRARLTSTALTEAAVAALPDVTSFVPEWDPTHTYYEQAVTGRTEKRWLGAVGVDFFGLVGWMGQEFDDPATPDNEREIGRDYSAFIGSPSSRVIRYLQFYVGDRGSLRDAVRTVVTGPGLPASGLTLIRPIADVPRGFWVLQGDQWYWNTFSTDRCAQVARPANAIPEDTRPVIPDCALDWSKVHRGSLYTFEYFDAAGASLGTDSRQLQIDPSLAVLQANREALFPRIQTNAASEFSIKNIRDDRSGSLFRDGATLPLSWIAPSDPLIKVTRISMNREIKHPYGELKTQIEYIPLYGLAPTQHSFTLGTSPAGYLTNWAYVTLEAHDAFGNVFDHELSPFNPR